MTPPISSRRSTRSGLQASSSRVALAEEHRQSAGSSKAAAYDLYILLLGVEAEIRQTVEQRLDDDFCFHPREMHPEASMRTKCEGHMLARRAMNIEAVWILET